MQNVGDEEQEGEQLVKELAIALRDSEPDYDSTYEAIRKKVICTRLSLAALIHLIITLDMQVKEAEQLAKNAEQHIKNAEQRAKEAEQETREVVKRAEEAKASAASSNNIGSVNNSSDGISNNDNNNKNNNSNSNKNNRDDIVGPSEPAGAEKQKLCPSMWGKKPCIGSSECTLKHIPLCQNVVCFGNREVRKNCRNWYGHVLAAIRQENAKKK